jgi:hypothetical protein
MDCPFKIKLVISKDGNHLQVKELEKNHNHDIHEVAYRHLPRQQQLDEETKNEARKMLSLKANTKLIHCLNNKSNMLIIKYTNSIYFWVGEP